MGWLKQLEGRGVRWPNDSGVLQDSLQILKDHGIDSVRLRVFVNPPPSNFGFKRIIYDLTDGSF
ncbi:MAG: glycosyl hydrolase 53 family protein [Firmicutes bacterium]|nr:glycosyl hydrolase 53 family protein [Bacillota bacterium]